MYKCVCVYACAQPAENGFYEATAANGMGMVICIGDIHGNVRELNMLWKGGLDGGCKG